jgi:hypothetical protein
MMQGTRLRLINSHLLDVREEYRMTGLRIRELEWFEFHALQDNHPILVRTSTIASIEPVEAPPRQA